MNTYKTLIPCAVCDRKMTIFKQIRPEALNKYSSIAQTLNYKSDYQLSSEIMQKWEQKKQVEINRIIGDRRNRELYMKAKDDYNRFIVKHKSIIDEYQMLGELYADRSDLIGIFTGKNKCERFYEAHRSVIDEEYRLRIYMIELSRYETKESDLIRSVEQAYSISSEAYSDFRYWETEKEKNKYRSDCNSKVLKWKSEFNITYPCDGFLIGDMVITTEQSNAYNISCRKLYRIGSFDCSPYNETVMNKEIKIIHQL